MLTKRLYQGYILNLDLMFKLTVDCFNEDESAVCRIESETDSETDEF